MPRSHPPRPRCCSCCSRGGADTNWACTDTGFTALMFVALEGQTSAVQQLLENGASVTKVGTDEEANGWTALMSAANCGDLAIVRLLLNAGARVNAGLIPSGLTALMMASKDGHTEVTQLLLDRGADPTAACSDDHSNALMLAASWGHMGTVRLLASFGTDVAAKTVGDETAQDFAIESGMLEIADWLDTVAGWYS